MRLYQTLHNTIKWKWVLFWYLFLLFVPYMGTRNFFGTAEAIFGGACLTFLTLLIVFSVFGKAIYGGDGYLPIIWPFRIIFEIPIKYDSIKGHKMRN